MVGEIVLLNFFGMDLQLGAFELNSQICSAVRKEAICTAKSMTWFGSFMALPIWCQFCQQEPSLFPFWRDMALETNFGLGTIETI